MPWIIRGKTPCQLCGMVIEAEDEVVVFPPLAIRDTGYRIFSDAVMHRTCFFEHPLKSDLIKQIKNIYDPNDAMYGAVLLKYVADLDETDEQDGS